jgi:hypothetical protein
MRNFARLSSLRRCAISRSCRRFAFSLILGLPCFSTVTTPSIVAIDHFSFYDLRVLAAAGCEAILDALLDLGQQLTHRDLLAQLAGLAVTSFTQLLH